MVVATQPLTYKDLASTPEGDGNRYELLGGEMFVTPSPAKRHIFLTSRLFLLLSNHVLQNSLGHVFHAPVDVRLTPYDVVVPDILFLSAERANIFGDRLIEGPPDLVAEVLSPSTRSRDLETKRLLYARTGVSEYWIVDIDRSSVTVHILNAAGEFDILVATDGLIESRVLPE